MRLRFHRFFVSCATEIHVLMLNSCSGATFFLFFERILDIWHTSQEERLPRLDLSEIIIEFCRKHDILRTVDILSPRDGHYAREQSMSHCTSMGGTV